MSNVVCRVIDAADFLRNAHADQGFRDAGDEAFSRLAEYIQVVTASAITLILRETSPEHTPSELIPLRRLDSGRESPILRS